MHVRVDNRDGAACAGLGLSTTPIHARPTGRTIFTGPCCEAPATGIAGDSRRGRRRRDEFAPAAPQTRIRQASDDAMPVWPT
jgi:hypothetical protein